MRQVPYSAIPHPAAWRTMSRVSINNENFVFLDNQWEIDMLININPSFEREILVNSSKYYKIMDLNTFLKESNDDCLKFSINQFGYYEANKRLYVQGKEEDPASFSLLSCESIIIYLYGL